MDDTTEPIDAIKVDILDIALRVAEMPIHKNYIPKLIAVIKLVMDRQEQTTISELLKLK